MYTENCINGAIRTLKCRRERAREKKRNKFGSLNIDLMDAN